MPPNPTDRPARPTLHLRLPRPAHTIIVEDEVFGSGFGVRVTPAPEGIGHDRGLATLPEAEEYAARLAKATLWPIVFLVAGAVA